MMLRRLLVAALLMAVAAPAVATPGSPTYTSWSPTGRASLSVSSASSNVALPSVGPVAYLCNTGAQDIFLNFGTANTVTASASTSYRLTAGTCASYDISPTTGLTYTYLAGITAAATSSLYIETGRGSLTNTVAGGGSGGVVLQGTVPWLTLDQDVVDALGSPMQQSGGSVALAAGTATIGKLAANSGVDIGDVTLNNASIAVTQSTSPWVVSCTNCSSGGGGGTSSDFNTAFPDAGTAAGMSDGTDMVPLFSSDGTSLDVAVTNTVAVSGTFWQATQPVSGPLTDAQLRATAVPVSGTFWQATQPVSGPLTDAQLRAVAVPISAAALPLPLGAAVAANQQTDALTDTELRASPVPVSGTVSVSGTIGVTQSTSPWVVSGTVTANAGTGSFTVAQPTAANLNATVVGTGTFATQAAQSGSWSVTANAGTNLNTSALALDTTLAGLTLAQASTTSGQLGPLVQGAVTTSAPSYTTGRTSPLSITTAGGLRVDGTGGSFPVSGTVAATQSGTWNIATVSAVTAITNALPPGSNVIGHVITDSGSTTAVTGTVTVSGSVTANAGTNLNTSLLAMESGGNLASLVTQIGAVTASPTANTVNDRLKTINTSLGTINSTLGSPFQAGGSIGNTSFAATQASAAALNATVVGTGTFAVQAAQSGSWTVTANAGTGTFGVSGTVTANLGTLNGAATAANQTSVQGAVNGGTAATASELVAGIYHASAPTLTNGQQSGLQLDSSGNIKVNVVAGGGAGGTSSTFGAAFPGTGTAIGMSDGADMVPFTTSDGTALDVNCTIGCAGGTFNNNADNVAPSSTNGQAAAWAYVWDGSAWDRLYGDATNGAWANIKTSVLPTGAATSANQSTEITALGTINSTLGSPFQAGGSIGNTSFAVTQGTAASLKAQVVGAGTAGSQTGGVLTVQGDPSGTPLPISGSITATVSGVATAANQTAVIGTKAPGTAAASALLAGGVYNSGGVTLSNGQQAALQLAADGTLNITCVTGCGSGGGTQDVNLLEVGGAAVDIGSGAAGSGTQRVILASDQDPVDVAQSGSWSMTANAGTNLNTSALLTSSTFTTTLGSASVAVASGADDVANTLAGLEAYARPSWFDGSTWDRAPGNSTDGLLVNLGANNDVTVSGTVSVTGVATATNQTGGGQKTQIVDGSGNVIGATSNALNVNISGGNPTTIAVTQSTSPWIVAGGGTAGSAASGVITVQGIASMTPVQVSQASAASLNATVVGTGTFAVQAAATQSGNWTSRIVGNAGATLDATVGAATAPTNMLAVGGVYNSTEPSPTTGQSVALQLDSKGRQRQVIMDAAGNTRGVNVNASNQLSVSLDGGTGATVTLGAGSATIGALTANQSVNLAQVNGVTTLAGNGASGTGAQRVTIANDSTGVLASIGSITSSVVPGTAASNLGKAEDAGAASGDTGVGMLVLQQSSPADAAGNTDYAYPQMSGGRLWTNTGFPTGSAVPATAIYNGANVAGNLTGVIGCGQSAIYDASTSGSTQLVALQSSQTIYICGYTIMASGTVNVNLRYGTGTNCATSPSNIVPAFQLTAQAGAVDGSAFYRGLKTIASNALCINTSGAVAVQAIVYYTQF